MSILIKGMEMPKSCNKCDLRVIAIGLDFQCAISGETVDDYYSSRHPKCPLVEIPTPHGRLIDADELKKNMRNYYPSIDHLCCSQHVVTKRDIDCAPTIIEAEVGEE